MERQVLIPRGTATLGLAIESGQFGWDNEFDVHQVDVPDFSIDVYKVTNGEYLRIHQRRRISATVFLEHVNWEWITASGVQHPKFWKPVNGGWQCPNNVCRRSVSTDHGRCT